MKFLLRRILSALAALIILSGSLSLASCKDTENNSVTPSGTVSMTSVAQTDGVSSVLLNSRGNKMTVRMVLSSEYIATNPRATIYLFEIGEGESEKNLTGLEPVYSFRASEKSAWSTSLSYGAFTRLHNSYVLAADDSSGGYIAIGSAVPLLNPEVLATRTFKYPSSSSIKGINTDSVSDALSLGVSHTVLDINIEDYIMIPDPAVPETLGSVKYVYNGITYHFSSSALASLDAKVKTLTDEAVTVYFRFTLATLPAELPDKLKCLGFADAPSADLYAININDAECAGYMAALFGLFSERYTRADGENGFCGSFIIGSDVNNASTSNSSGAGIDADAYISAYERLLRLARTVLVSNYSNGRVYISLGNNWNVSLTEGDGNNDCSASNFLSSFSTITSASGDYNWGVAASAYALDITDSSIWDDSLAIGASSQYLSPANINVLTYALSKSYTFAGIPRSVIIASFGVRGDPSDLSSRSNQAASYAYAYYKVAADSAVDAFIYSSLDDTPGDTDSFGLRSSSANKPIWDVFATIDTVNDSAVGTVAALAGSEFSYLYGSLSSTVKVKSFFTGKTSTPSDLPDNHRLQLFDFTSGDIFGFTLVSSAGSLDLSRISGRPALHILSLGEAGIVKNRFDGYLIKDTTYLIVNLASSNGDGEISLRLSQNGSAQPLYFESRAAYKAGNQFISFDISLFSEAIEDSDVNLSLWFQPQTADIPVELSVAGIELADSEPAASPVLWIVVLSIIVFFVLLMLLALFSRMFHRIRRRRARKNRQNGGALTPIDDN